MASDDDESMDSEQLQERKKEREAKREKLQNVAPKATKRARVSAADDDGGDDDDDGGGGGDDDDDDCGDDDDDNQHKQRRLLNARPMAVSPGLRWITMGETHFALVVRIVARARDRASYYATVVGTPSDARKRARRLTGDLHIKFTKPLPFFPYHDVRLEYTVAILKEKCDPRTFLYKTGSRRRLDELRALSNEDGMICLTARDAKVINVNIPRELESLEV